MKKKRRHSCDFDEVEIEPISMSYFALGLLSTIRYYLIHFVKNLTIFVHFVTKRRIELKL